MSENRLFGNDYVEPIVTDEELEKNLEEILKRAEVAPLDGEDTSQLRQILSGRDDLREKYALQLEKIQRRDQVAGAIKAWKKLMDLPFLNPFDPDASAQEFERKEEIKNLRKIIDAVSDEVILDVASESYTMMKKGKLEQKSNRYYNDNEYEQEQAEVLREELEDILKFAQWRKLAKNDIEKAGNEWNTQDIERRKKEALDVAKKAALDLRKLQYRMKGFPISMRNDFPEEFEERARLDGIITNARRAWRFTEEEVNVDADAWSKETNERDKAEALASAKQAALRYRQLEHETGGFRMDKRDEQREQLEEARQVEQVIREAKRRWSFTDEEINVDADAWYQETNRRERAAAVERFEEISLRVQQLNQENRGWPLSKRAEQQEQFEEKERLEKEATELKRRWRLTENLPE